MLKYVHIGDVDGDGITEMIYNVVDPTRQFRAFVRVCNADTGEIEIELPDQWAVAPFVEVGDERASGLLTMPAPDGAVAAIADMTARLFAANGILKDIGTIRQARLWGPHLLPADRGNDLLLRQGDALVRLTVRDGKLVEVARTEAPALLQSPIQNTVEADGSDGQYQLVSPQGVLQSVSWDGALRWELPLQVTRPPVVSAADLNGDGRAELIVASGDQRVRIIAFSNAGRTEETANYEYRMAAERHSPLLSDLTGTGDMCLIAPGTTDDGHITIRAYRADGSPLWDSPLDYSAAYNANVVACNAGRSLPGGAVAVVVHLTNSIRSDDATFGLDGKTGKVLWVKRGTYNGMPYRPEGMVSAVDIDGDGLDELANDMLAYMSYVRGADGSYALIKPLGDFNAGGLYSCFTPLYPNTNDAKPHWLVPSGTGSFGMFGPDLRTIWSEQAGYDVPGHVGIVDVDGDGVLEAGYAIKNSRTFKCRNVWTGDVKWQLELETPPNSPVLSADVDGDGKGEFLAGRYCIGTDDQGRGQVRFELPVPLAIPEPWSYSYLKGGAALIADFDGDGLGEIACTANGRIMILKAHRPAPSATETR